MQLFSQFTGHLNAHWDTAIAAEASPWPFFTFAWHQHWHTQFSAQENLVILKETETQVVLPLSIKDQTAHFTGGEEIADYLDAVGQGSCKAAAWQSALPLLKQHGAARLLLRNIPSASPTIEYFRNLSGADITQEDTTPILTLPSSFDEYLAALNRKNRHELKRKLKKFESEHAALSFIPKSSTSIDTASLLLFMRHDPDKMAFLTDNMTRFFEQLPAVLPETTWQFVLTANERIIASTLAFRTDDSLLLYNSGFDPRYPGAGWYIKVKTIMWAIDQHLTSYNFLQGNERYKYDFGGVDQPVYRVTLPL